MNSLEELKTNYEDFLRSDEFNYVDKITQVIDDYATHQRNHNPTKNTSSSAPNKNNTPTNKGIGCPRVKIKLSELRSFNSVLERRLVNDPLRHLRAIEFAAHEVASEERQGYDTKHGELRHLSAEGL